MLSKYDLASMIMALDLMLRIFEKLVWNQYIALSIEYLPHNSIVKMNSFDAKNETHL